MKSGKHGNARFSYWMAWKSICSCKTAIFSRKSGLSQIYFVPLQPECWCAVAHSFLLLLLTCIRSTLIGNNEATRFCLEFWIWKIHKWARRSTTVHVYTWACRLIVFLHGIPEPEYRDCGIRKPTFRIYAIQPSASLKIFLHRILPPVKAALSGGHALSCAVVQKLQINFLKW